MFACSSGHVVTLPLVNCLLVSIMQSERWSRRKECEWLAAEKALRRSVVLTEWRRTCSLPQNKEVC